jgi:hypothetical protein
MQKVQYYLAEMVRATMINIADLTQANLVPLKAQLGTQITLVVELEEGNSADLIHLGK